jgi:predicted dehydrogenase
VRPLRFVHVGTGGWGRRWSDTFLPHLVCTGRATAAAVDANPDALLLAQRGYGIEPERCYTDAARAFAEREADFAVVVVPPAHHEEVVELTLAHGCDVLCEKPLAASIEACARIYHRVHAAGRRLAVTMSHRFDADKQTLERLVASGDYGPLHYLVCRMTYNMRRRGDWGGPRHDMADPLLVEGAVHQLDVVRAIGGANARRVFASSWNPPGAEYAGDSTARVLVELDNGVQALYEGAKANASTLSPREGEYWRAECRDVTLELDRRRLRLLRSETPEAPPAATDVPLDERPVWMNAWLAEQFVDWLEGGPPPPTNLEAPSTPRLCSSPPSRVHTRAAPSTWPTSSAPPRGGRFVRARGALRPLRRRAGGRCSGAPRRRRARAGGRRGPRALPARARRRGRPPP